MTDNQKELLANIAPFGLRMQPELKERVKDASERNGRSMNAEIVGRLEWSLARPPEEQSPSVGHVRNPDDESASLRQENASLKREVEKLQISFKYEQEARLRSEQLYEQAQKVNYGYQDVLENMRGQALHYISMVRSLTDYVLNSKGPAPEGWVRAANGMLQIVSQAHDHLISRPSLDRLREEQVADGERLLKWANEQSDEIGE